MRGTTTRTPKVSKWEAARTSSGRYACPHPDCTMDFDRPAGLGRHWSHAHAGDSAISALAHLNNGGRHEMHPLALANEPGGRMADPAPEPAETMRVRRACDAALSILMSDEWRGLTAGEKWDVVGVLRFRLARETALATSLLTGDTADANMAHA